MLFVEKMCGMRKKEGMQTICSWLGPWGQRLFKVITFTVSGQQPAPHDVNRNIPICWESGCWDLLKIEVDFTLINKSFNKFHRSSVDFYFLGLFWRIRWMVHDQVKIYVWLRRPEFTSACVNEGSVVLQEKSCP